MCQYCEVLKINNVLCHETGCPFAWRDYVRKCKWCGAEFKPKQREQEMCSWDCSDRRKQEVKMDALTMTKTEYVDAALQAYQNLEKVLRRRIINNIESFRAWAGKAYDAGKPLSEILK